MKTKLFIIIGLFLITSVSAKASDDNKDKKTTYSTNGNPNDNLSKKRYYQNVFTKKERKELKKAEKYVATADKYLKAYQKNIKLIERLNKVVEHSKSDKTKKKSSKKIKKLKKKAFKSAFKAIENYKKATNTKKSIYYAAADRIRLKDGSQNAGYGIRFEMQAKDVFKEVENLESLASTQQTDEKIKTLLDAKNRTLYAIMLKGLAISNYKNDTSGNNFLKEQNPQKQTTKEEAKKIKEITSSNDNSYSPLNDNNIYRTRANLIIPKLNMSGADLELLRKNRDSEAKANRLSRQVDNLYEAIDSLHVEAESPNNEFEREQIHGKAANKEMTAFAKLIQATKLYTSVNQARYRVYSKYLNNLRQTKESEKVQRASQYVNAAEMSFQNAQNKTAIAKKLMSKPEQYIKLMGANDLLLQAIQLQEEAFAIYLGIQQSGSIRDITENEQYEGNKINEKTKSDKNVQNSSKLRWQFASRNVYSKEKPKVVRYKDKKGIVFTVQVGIFKGILPPSKFGNIQPIIFDKFVKNPYRRYMVGECRTTEAADLALSKVKNLGYSDAYIVALENGIRKSYSSAKSLVNKQSAQYNKLKQSELARLNGKKAVYAKTANEAIPAASSSNNGYYTDTDDVTKTKGLLYFVQLGMFIKPISVKDDFKGLEPILYEKVEGRGRRYMLGTFGMYSVAKQEAMKVKNQGYKAAFVTSYYDGQHISLDEARKIEKNQYAGMQRPYQPQETNQPEIQSKPISNNIKFAVQVGAYSDEMSNTDINNLKQSFSERAINHKIMGGMHVYYIGNYDKYEGANYLKKRLQSEGHAGIFVIAFQNNTKIPLSQAIKK